MPFDWLTEETTALLVQGLALTIWLTAITSVGSLALGVALGIMKMSAGRFWRFLASATIEVNRNIPALVWIIFWAFAFPHLFPPELRKTIFFQNDFVDSLSRVTGLSVPYYTLAAGLALTLNTSAYLAELFRAGVGTIAQSHIDSARTLGAPRFTVLRRIVIPQGLRASFPGISTRLIHNMKNTALAALVAVPEFFHNTQTAISRSFRAVEFLALAAVVYLALAFLFASLLGWIETNLTRTFKQAHNGIPAGRELDMVTE